MRCRAELPGDIPAIGTMIARIMRPMTAELVDWIRGSDCYVPELNLPPAAFIFQTNNGGRTWTNDVLPPDTSVLSQISCANAANCVAAGGGWNHGGAAGPPDLLTTRDGGTTWMARSLLAPILDINSISCPAVTSCIVVGSAGPSTLEQPLAAVAVTDDGGDTWTTP